MLKVINSAGIGEIHMDRAPANALNLQLVDRIRTAHRELCEANARAIVLTGRPGIFSGGVDVPELLPLDRAGILAFWHGFFALNKSLVTSSVPVIAALSGHSPAGGAVLALHCDYRIAARGSFKFGLNEVAVGLAVPPSIMVALTEVVGPRLAHRLTMLAELLPMEQAVVVGAVDEIVEPEKLLDHARELATRMARLPPIAQARTRWQARSALLQALNPEREAELATDYWFSEETQNGMRELVARLGRK
jgi:enoyl-CoA hydratase/carnithine racemase